MTPIIEYVETFKWHLIEFEKSMVGEGHSVASIREYKAVDDIFRDNTFLDNVTWRCDRSRVPAEYVHLWDLGHMAKLYADRDLLADQVLDLERQLIVGRYELMMATDRADAFTTD